jgi:adenylate cyclase
VPMHPWRRAAKATAVGVDVASVAVLPFDNLTGNPTDQYLSDGMTEEVIGQLARVRGLKSSAAYLDSSNSWRVSP